MKKLLTILLLLISTNVLSQDKTYSFPITRVIDGDTVAFKADFLPDPLKKELSLRVFGVDTPEKGHRAKCVQEDTKGKDASNYTKNLLTKSKDIKLVIKEWDKYGGRVLGDVIIDGVSLRYLLISNGYAREYFGDKKQSWCP